VKGTPYRVFTARDARSAKGGGKEFGLVDLRHLVEYPRLPLNMSESNQVKIIVPGLIGAGIGGAVGYFAFFWITRQGFYALVLPGGLLGLGAGLCARGRSIPLAVICGIAALLLGLVAEWKFAPFIKDGGFGYFLANVSSLKPVRLFMIVVGAILGFRLALGRSQKSTSEVSGTN